MAAELKEFEALNVCIGRECTEIRHREYDWIFLFEEVGTVLCACPWRIICDSRIALTNIDDGQLFGLKRPVDGSAKAKELIVGKEVVAVKIAPISSDLSITFEGETLFELFNHSSGYEGWQAIAKLDYEEIHFVAMGGGQLAIFKLPPGLSPLSPSKQRSNQD